MIRKIIKNPFVIAFIVGVCSLHLIKQLALMRRSAPEPMVYVDDWSLIDQEGKIFGQKDLKGKIVIADFFFTSCPSICPKLTEAMKQIYDRLGDKEDQVSFVSISVDPTTDTPKVLQEFMRKNSIDKKNWHCLTGSKKEIYDVVVQKMRVHMGEKEIIDEASGSYDIPHLAHLALFDQKGDLRGLFKTESVELAALVRAAKFLLEKS